MSDFETVEITVGQATTGLTLKVSQTVESLSDAASTKNEQMGKPVIVHQVPVSLNIVCVGVCLCVRHKTLHHVISLCGSLTSSSSCMEARLQPQAVK